MDGRNVFEFEWQVRARDWLLENGLTISSHRKNEHLVSDLYLVCPASEFCARAIHQLIGSEKAA